MTADPIELKHLAKLNSKLIQINPQNNVASSEIKSKQGETQSENKGLLDEFEQKFIALIHSGGTT